MFARDATTIRSATTAAVVVAFALVSGCGGGGAENAEPEARPNPAPSALGAGDAADRPEAPARERVDAPVVVFLGDSLTAGYQLPEDAAFPAVLERRLADDGVRFRGINAGVSGDTSAGGLRRLDWVLRSGPELVVVGLGANDGLRGQPLDNTVRNLESIVEGAQAAGARVVLLGMDIPTSYGPEYTSRFAALYGEVAERTGATLVPGFLRGVGGVEAFVLPDGLHPNEEGHRRLADTLEPTLRRVLETLESENLDRG